MSSASACRARVCCSRCRHGTAIRSLVATPLPVVCRQQDLGGSPSAAAHPPRPHVDRMDPKPTDASAAAVPPPRQGATASAAGTAHPPVGQGLPRPTRRCERSSPGRYSRHEAPAWSIKSPPRKGPNRFWCQTVWNRLYASRSPLSAHRHREDGPIRTDTGSRPFLGNPRSCSP